MYTTADIEKALEKVMATSPRSAWCRGVKAYAVELLEEIQEAIDWNEEHGKGAESYTPSELEKLALNGARNWTEFSEGGCALVYTADIVERLCTPSEIRMFRDGKRSVLFRCHCLEWQSRALWQAFRLILDAVREVAADHVTI